MTFEARLEIFEGPLDLLLHLVKTHEIDISDIPIATITDQYLQYLDLLRALDINVAGEFLVMASTLMHIKSKMLFPAEEQDLEEIEALKEEVFRPLREYLQMKEAATELASRDILYRDVFKRGSAISGRGEFEEQVDTPRATLYELMEAFRDVMKRRYPGVVLKFKAEKWSVQQKSVEIMKRLKKQGNLYFTDLFSEGWSVSELIATFLALLELVKNGSINVFQAEHGGDIRLEVVGSEG